METVLPEDLSAADVDHGALIEALTAEFDKAFEENADLATLTEIADALDVVRAAETAVKQKAAEDAAERDKLRSRVAPTDEADADEATETEDDAEATADGEDDDTAEADADAESKELVTASGKAPSAKAVASKAKTPTPPVEAKLVAITAAGDVPGWTSGQAVTKDELAVGLHARAYGLADHSPRHLVASIELDNDTVITKTMTNQQIADAITAAVDSKLEGKDAAALIAAGGWCTPSETLFDQFSVEGRTGLLDLPSIGIQRGGLSVPSYFGIADAAGALWSWSEADDLNAAKTVTNAVLTSNVATLTTSANHGYVVGQTVKVENVSLSPVFNGTYVITVVGSATTFSYARTAANVATAASTGTVDTVKGCLAIPCPTWTDYRLAAEGLCVSHGNLMDRSYPEMTTRFIDLVMTAHLHRLSNLKLSKIVASATAVTVTTKSDAAGDILNAVDLQVADFRSQHLMDVNVVLDAIFPLWFKEAIRSTLAMRAGIDKLNVADSEIVGYFTSRNVRPQFLHGYQPLYSASPATTWPATSKFLIFPAGSYVDGNGGKIDLGVVRDSVLNATNDFTAAWSEQFFVVIRRGPAAREVTVTTTVDGDTGGPKA